MRKVAYQDRVFISACFMLLFLVGVALFWNARHAHYLVNYQGVHRNAIVLLSSFFTLYLVLVVSGYHFFSQMLKAIVMLFIVITLKYCCDLAVLTSAFPTQDHFIVKIDESVGFHFLAVLRFFHAHMTPFYSQIIWIGYFSILILIQLLPLFYAAFEKTDELYRFFLSFLLSLFIGYGICYFFPTLTSPAAMYPHHYFTTLQLESVRNYQLLHAHKKVNFDFIGSVVSFPSYHAIWITFFVFFLWGYRKIRIFLVVYGIGVMTTLILTGWHYLFDLIGGIAVGVISIFLADYFLGAKQEGLL